MTFGNRIRTLCPFVVVQWKGQKIKSSVYFKRTTREAPLRRCSRGDQLKRFSAGHRRQQQQVFCVAFVVIVVVVCQLGNVHYNNTNLNSFEIFFRTYWIVVVFFFFVTVKRLLRYGQKSKRFNINAHKIV